MIRAIFQKAGRALDEHPLILPLVLCVFLAVAILQLVSARTSGCREMVLMVEAYEDRALCDGYAKALIVTIDERHAVVHCVCPEVSP